MATDWQGILLIVDTVILVILLLFNVGPWRRV